MENSIKEANEIIDSIKDEEIKFLYLDNMGLSEKNIVLPKRFYDSIYLGNNNFTKLELEGKGILDISNNKIKNLENLKIKGFDNIIIDNNPLLKKYLSYRKLNFKNIIPHKSYQTIVIKKGTLLFRSVEKLDDIKAMFIGFKNGESFTLNPDQHIFFHTSPINLLSKNFGKFKTIFVLNNNIELILGGIEPAKLERKDILKEGNFYSDDFCKDKEQRKGSYNHIYKCLKDDYKDLNYMGWYSDNMNLKIQNLEQLKDFYYFTAYKTLKGRYISEISMYPYKKRFKDTININPEDFDESWMKKHLHEFNYKPFMIFDETVTSEEYKSIFDKLLSEEGFTNEDGTFHVTVNKIDGTYVLAEEASSETLEDCVSLKEDRLTYLKEYVKNQ
jgi:hypothetical protein